MRFPAQSFADLTAYISDLPVADGEAITAAKARDAVLTKPPGALGRLEDLAAWYAGWRGEAAPRVNAPQVIVFAGNHGICAQGISTFPAEVTHQMVGNFEAGGAAINQLSDLAGAQMGVVALDLDNPTADFSQAPAMDEAACLAAMQAGWDAVDPSADLLVVGEMGIGNTTSAAAIATALLGGSGADWAGRGTGLDDAGVRHKAGVIDAAVAKHGVHAPLEVLATFGGREIAAMAGAMLRARAERMPVILDGFICSAAALVLHQADEAALDHCVAGHLSAEGAHRNMLKAIEKTPLLDLGLRLGEGSGAALAIQIVKAALASHSGMATFAEAGVADG